MQNRSSFQILLRIVQNEYLLYCFLGLTALLVAVTKTARTNLLMSKSVWEISSDQRTALILINLEVLLGFLLAGACIEAMLYLALRFHRKHARHAHGMQH